MTERTCIRGCVRPGIHYATCEHSGPTYEGAFPCRGCAPRECRDGSLVCDKCFGRIRGLLNDVRDLTGRLTALADPAKATPLDRVRVAASSLEAPAPISADLLDALGTLTTATQWAYIDLAEVSNDLETITFLCALILARHPEVNGTREAWSVQDAVDRWGVERRTDQYVYPDDEDDLTLYSAPIREWYDPLLTVKQAAKRAEVTQRTVQRWISDDNLPVTARMRAPDGSVVTYVKASTLDMVAKQATEARHNGGRGKPRLKANT